MKWRTHNDKAIDTVGTHGQGTIQAGYEVLEQLLGKPLWGDGDKTDAEWAIEYEDGVVVTIYNWKDGRNYLGEAGYNVEDITIWHIGGMSPLALERIQNLYNNFVMIF